MAGMPSIFVTVPVFLPRSKRGVWPVFLLWTLPPILSLSMSFFLVTSEATESLCCIDTARRCYKLHGWETGFLRAQVAGGSR